MRKYILENFLEKIRNLTPIQNFKKNFNKYTKKDFKILNATKKLYKEKNHFSREEIKAHSILFIMIQNPAVVKLKTDELSELIFSSEECNNLKNEIINLVSEESNLDKMRLKLNNGFKNLISDIEKKSILKNIIAEKDENDKLILLNELLEELKEMNHLKKIELLESKAAKNLDENSYSELIKLKSQLNRD